MPLVAYYANNCPRHEEEAGKRNPGDLFVEVMYMLAIALITRFSRRHLVDRTPVGRKILKPTPKIFGVTKTKCTLIQV